jgi:YbbR domain-containing protein
MKIGSIKNRLKLGEDQAVLMICMAIALLFWFFVKMSKTYDTIRPIKINYQLPEGFDFQQKPVDVLYVKYSEQGWSLISTYLFDKNESISFNLNDVQDIGKINEEILEAIQSASKLKVLGFTPENLGLSLDKTSIKKVPVVLESDFQMEPDFFITDSIVIEPDSVVIWGPGSSLSNITHIKTEPITLKGLKSSQAITAALSKPEGKYLKLSETKVQVLISVEQFTEKTFRVPVFVKSNDEDDSIQIVPTAVELTCSVVLSRFDEIKESDFVVEAILPEKTASARTNYAALIISKQPNLVKSVRIKPNNVEFFIVK